MIRRVFVLLVLVTSLISLLPGDLIGEDPPIEIDPGDIFGDPDDEFKPGDLGLSNVMSMGETVSGGLHQKVGIGPDPSNEIESIIWNWIGIDPFDR